MSRLEKAREGKKRNKKKLFLGILIIVILIAVFFGCYLNLFGSIPWTSENEPDMIDREKSAAKIDMFEQTYVRIFLLDNFDGVEVLANDSKINYNPDAGRWETVLQGLRYGDRINIAVEAAKGRQNIVLTVEILGED